MVMLALCVGLAQVPNTKQVPHVQVDPFWPQWPETWIMGASAGIATDASNNVWLIHRPASVTDKRVCCKPAPVVMQFDPAGKLLQSWNGPGEGYQWPLENDEHGIFVDHKNNVWIAGRGANGTSENQLLKFDSKGKFLLQIGRRGMGNDSNDTQRLGQPADMAVYPQTNEVFVADGYGNRRVIVFDADTGMYKRHWGAYGNKPDDAAPKTPRHQGPGDSQFNQVHHIFLSGGSATIPGLPEVVAERTQVNSLVANPFVGMEISSKVRQAQLTVDAPALLVACGLALRRFDE